MMKNILRAATLVVFMLCGGTALAEMVNINKADAAALMENLPGIGETKAKAIVKYRKENGNFKSIDGLLEVPGIGEKTFKNLKSEVSVSKGATKATGKKPITSVNQTGSGKSGTTEKATKKDSKSAKKDDKSTGKKAAKADDKAKSSKTTKKDSKSADKSKAAKKDDKSTDKKAKAKSDSKSSKATSDSKSSSKSKSKPKPKATPKAKSKKSSTKKKKSSTKKKKKPAKKQ